MKYQRCEYGNCKDTAVIILYRVGHHDPEGTGFCTQHAKEALDSGEYSEESTDDLERNYEG
ncbi:MAG TPA: hypothetical protein VIY48_19465 [Candidatus Paceibacterota bacterium]